MVKGEEKVVVVGRQVVVCGLVVVGDGVFGIDRQMVVYGFVGVDGGFVVGSLGVFCCLVVVYSLVVVDDYVVVDNYVVVGDLIVVKL